jgi:hypothetical protein
MSEDLKCPKCGAVLEKGYLQAPKGLYWDNKKHNWSTFSSEEILDYLSITIPNKEASRCQNCKLVVFTY